VQLASRQERHPEVTTVHSPRTAGLAALIVLAVGALTGCDDPTPTTAPVAPAASAPTPVPEPVRTPSLSLPPPQDPRVDDSPAGVPASDHTTDAQVPPEPVCPGPPGAPDIPDISATVGGGDPVEGRIGSFTIRTCSTMGSADIVGGDPDTPLMARQGGALVVTITAPWHVVRWAGSDRAVDGDAANTRPPVHLPDRPRSFTLGVPPRSGDSILDLDLELVSDDGRAVASIPVSFLVRVAP
jgi:hypothetical protein